MENEAFYKKASVFGGSITITYPWDDTEHGERGNGSAAGIVCEKHINRQNIWRDIGTVCLYVGGNNHIWRIYNIPVCVDGSGDYFAGEGEKGP